MSDSLSHYYESELAVIRKAMSSFATRNPDAAEQLKVNQGIYEDPNISRLIDAAALLNAKTEKRLDEQLPEVIDGLISILYPSLNQIIPSCALLELDASPEQLTETKVIPEQSLFTVTSRDGNECNFITVEDVQLQPFSLTHVCAAVAPFKFERPAFAKGAGAVIQLTLTNHDPDASFSNLDFDDFHFFIQGFEKNADSLIELLLSKTLAISVSDPGFEENYEVDAQSLESRVTDPEFDILPQQGNQFDGFQLLTEYFCFKEKSNFFWIKELGQISKNITGNQLVLSIYVESIPSEFIRLFDVQVFRLNVVPALNLFEHKGDPIRYEYDRISMPISADANTETELEIVSVECVKEVKPQGEVELTPLYGEKYHDTRAPLFWQIKRRIDELGKLNYELALSNQDITGEGPDNKVLSPDLMCCNGKTACNIAPGTEFICESSVDLPGVMKLLNSPTAPIYPSQDRGLAWRFISLLNINFHSLLQSNHPTDALKETLSIFGSQGEALSQIDNIKQVTYRSQVAPIRVCGRNIFAPGTEVEITLNTQGNLSLFGHVIDGFYQQFCSFDRFIQVHIKLFGQDGTLKSYPKRHGSQQCL